MRWQKSDALCRIFVISKISTKEKKADVHQVEDVSGWAGFQRGRAAHGAGSHGVRHSREKGRGAPFGALGSASRNHWEGAWMMVGCVSRRLSEPRLARGSHGIGPPFLRWDAGFLGVIIERPL